MNSNAQVDVMINPTGNMPRVVPGSANAAAFSAAAAAAVDTAAAAPAALWPWKMPETKKIIDVLFRFEEAFEPPSLSAPSCIVGIRSAMRSVLLVGQQRSGRHENLHSLLQFCQSQRAADLTYK